MKKTINLTQKASQRFVNLYAEKAKIESLINEGIAAIVLNEDIELDQNTNVNFSNDMTKIEITRLEIEKEIKKAVKTTPKAKKDVDTTSTPNT